MFVIFEFVGPPNPKHSMIRGGMYSLRGKKDQRKGTLKFKIRSITTITITTTKNMNTTTFPDSWYDLWKSDQPIDFEAFLNSELLAKTRNEIKTRGVIRRTSGSVSTIASMCLVVHILRSHHGLSTTYHRLVFGLCIADIMTSFAQALGSTMVPKEMNYFVPGAQGNTATCTAQGFVIIVGVGVAAVYNCSICFYYLAIIRYNKKDEYIRNKLEPWFHGISIVLPLAVGIILLAMKGYNAYGGVCHLRQYVDAPHCIGYESGDTPEGFSIPCGRGDGRENPILYLVTSIVGFGLVLIITPTVIAVTMLLMYRSVSKVEQRNQNYGVSMLRLNARRRSINDNHDENTENNNSTRCANDQHDGVMRRLKRFVMCMIPPCLRPRPDDQLPTTRSNRSRTSQKRAILHRAAGYALAWAFVYIPFMIITFLLNSNAKLILNACLTPLQGLFNFLVFMSPKARNAKRSIRGRKNLTWREAFIKAYMSRGERMRIDRNLSSRNTNRASGSIVSLLQRVRRSSLKSFLVRTSSHDRRWSNESNAHITTNDHSSNPKQVGAPAEKLTSLYPHLADDMKEAEGSSDAMSPQQQEDFLATGSTDDEEKYKEQKAFSHLG
jgi:hypothetical protein